MATSFREAFQDILIDVATSLVFGAVLTGAVVLFIYI